MKLLTRATFLTTCIALLGILLGCDGSNTYSVKTEIIQVDSLDQIILIEDSLVKPILYTNVNGLERSSLLQSQSNVHLRYPSFYFGGKTSCSY